MKAAGSAARAFVAMPDVSPSETQKPERELPADILKLDELLQRSDVEIFLVIGVYRSGKSQLIDAFERIKASLGLRDGVSASQPASPDRVLPTPPGKLIVHSINETQYVIDASGERFSALYPGEGSQQLGDGDPLENDPFLRKVAKRLAGVMLLLDLQANWKPKDHGREERTLIWNLNILRWLRNGGQYTAKHTPFFEDVSRQLHGMPKLDVPVQVLISKADQLPTQKINLPERPWRSAQVGRNVYPVGESPFFFGMHCLPDLHQVLLRSARTFRYDFVHSLLQNPNTGIGIQRPCGVVLAFDWLTQWKGKRPLLSTETAVRWQRRIDKLTGKAQRWKDLPDPEEVRL